MCCHYTIPTGLPVFPGRHRFEYSLLDAPKTTAITNSCFGGIIQDLLPHPTSQERPALLVSPFLVSTENWWGRRGMTPPYPFCPRVRLPLILSHPGCRSFCSLPITVRLYAHPAVFSSHCHSLWGKPHRPHQPGATRQLVWIVGFGPTAPCSQSMCATNCAISSHYADGRI